VTTTEHNFSIAGLNVRIRQHVPTNSSALPDIYLGWAISSPFPEWTPNVVIEIDRIAGFAVGRPISARHPAFDARIRAPGHLSLVRADAEGDIEFGADPIRANFRVDDQRHSIEAAIRVSVAAASVRRGQLILHSSCVVSGGRAFVFVGESGAGKSTIAEFLQESTAAVRIADELVVVARRQQEPWHAHATPFFGKVAAVQAPVCAPVQGIFFLHQATEHHLVAVDRSRSVNGLMRHVLAYAVDPDTAGRALSAVINITDAVPCFELHFAKNPSVAEVLGIT